MIALAAAASQPVFEPTGLGTVGVFRCAVMVFLAGCALADLYFRWAPPHNRRPISRAA